MRRWFKAFSRAPQAGNKAAGPVGGVLGGAIGGVVGVFTGVLGVGKNSNRRRRRQIARTHNAKQGGDRRQAAKAGKGAKASKAGARC